MKKILGGIVGEGRVPRLKPPGQTGTNWEESGSPGTFGRPITCSSHLPNTRPYSVSPGQALSRVHMCRSAHNGSRY